MTLRVLYLLLISTLLLANAHAYTVFQTNCTRPVNSYNFIQSPNSRGTLNILWSCLFTIIACTWSVLHPNVPEQRLDQYPGWKGYLLWKSKGLLSSAKTMIVIILAPELEMAKAAGDLGAAMETSKLMKPPAEEDKVQWTTTHSLFADMGGFVISYGGTATVEEQMLQAPELAGSLPSIEGDEPSELHLINHQPKIPSTVSMALDPVTEQAQSFMKARNGQRNFLHLTAAEILRLRKEKVLQKLPAISEDQINDKSTSDSFAEAIAVSQILWNAIQIIARAVKDLPISQLEIAVLAFSFCAVVLYGFSWKKPKAPQIPYVLLRYDRFVSIHAIKQLGLSPDGHWLSSLPIPNEYCHQESNKSNDYSNSGLIISSLGFGALHLTAWNFDFPTRIEQTLWRVASLFITTIAVSYFILVAILQPLLLECNSYVVD